MKVVLSILRSSRLLERIDMILNKPRSTHNVFQKYFFKKFWELKVRKAIHQNSLFGGHPCNFASKSKNHHYWTFVNIKVVLRIVRSSRSRQRIDMILNKPRSNVTHNVFHFFFIWGAQSQERHPPKLSLEVIHAILHQNRKITTI